jgi:hypothetical protein
MASAETTEQTPVLLNDTPVASASFRSKKHVGPDRVKIIFFVLATLHALTASWLLLLGGARVVVGGNSTQPAGQLGEPARNACVTGYLWLYVVRVSYSLCLLPRAMPLQEVCEVGVVFLAAIFWSVSLATALCSDEMDAVDYCAIPLIAIGSFVTTWAEKQR